ncbi:hypothetical protein JL721_6070 [Aureococcus anophagefferens]|nr:hypothetical protein JL721_6070 [Aureococcus anophagefferens]
MGRQKLATALLAPLACALVAPPPTTQPRAARRLAAGAFASPERLYPNSYVMPTGQRYATAQTRAQWLADWRAITECLARFPTATPQNLDRTQLAVSLNAACTDELAFMTGGARRRPSPFAITLVDALFVAAYCDAPRYARLREYALAQYVPLRMGDVCERVGSPRVAEVARTGGACFDQNLFDPATPEYEAMVKCHNVEYPVKHPDWRGGPQRDAQLPRALLSWSFLCRRPACALRARAAGNSSIAYFNLNVDAYRIAD